MQTAQCDLVQALPLLDNQMCYHQHVQAKHFYWFGFQVLVHSYSATEYLRYLIFH